MEREKKQFESNAGLNKFTTEKRNLRIRWEGKSIIIFVYTWENGRLVNAQQRDGAYSSVMLVFQVATCAIINIHDHVAFAVMLMVIVAAT